MMTTPKVNKLLKSNKISGAEMVKMLTHSIELSLYWTLEPPTLTLSLALVWGMLGDPDSLMWMWLMVQGSDAI